ncbi:hypothetical protein ACSNOH_09680 [Streptomyces sp. URMC 127]|uniref:hypothetical protein n=1 Tax=Streptomyces sp. URMC 127 TaxID=3423402 RepID=UPI003F1CF099
MTARPASLVTGALAVAVAARHAQGAHRLKSTLRSLHREDTAPRAAEPPAVVVHFVVPVLREQEHIADALAWYARLLPGLPGSTLTVVTTARERHERGLLIDQLASGLRRPPQLTPAEDAAVARLHDTAVGRRLSRDEVADALAPFPLTEQVVADALAQPAYQGLPVRHVHYDGVGREAAQVNHAVATLPPGPGEAYIAVYDIDSRPTPALLQHTVTSIARHHAEYGQMPPVVQQSARFTTQGTSSRGWERAVCHGAARLQTLWTLRREIPAFDRHARAVRHRHGALRAAVGGGGLAQTVGHGLWVRRDTFTRLGGLPTYTVLDDLPFGYQLTVCRIPVCCVPALAVAPGPEDIAALVAQGQRWFANYLDYAACHAAARSSGRGTAPMRASALLVGWYRGAAWLTRTPATVVCLLLAVHRRTAGPVRAAAGVALWLGVVTPVRQLAAADGRRPTAGEQVREALLLLAAYGLSSIGPALAVLDRLRPRAEELSPKADRRPAPMTREAL